jgi:CRP-like cAMP-binding protein
MNDRVQNCWLCAQRECCDMAGLLRDAGSEASAQVVVVDYPAGSELELAPRQVRALRSGAVKVLWPQSGQRARVLDFCYPGRLLGVASSLGVDDACRYVTLRWSRICVLPEAHAVPATALAARVAASIMPIYGRTRLMQAGAGERVADYLVRAFEGQRDLDGDALPARTLPAVSRNDIADYAGLRGESVSRALAQFRAAGWIRGKVDSLEILDLEALRGFVAAAA